MKISYKFLIYKIFLLILERIFLISHACDLLFVMLSFVLIGLSFANWQKMCRNSANLVSIM